MNKTFYSGLQNKMSRNFMPFFLLSCEKVNICSRKKGKMDFSFISVRLFLSGEHLRVFLLTQLSRVA